MSSSPGPKPRADLSWAMFSCAVSSPVRSPIYRVKTNRAAGEKATRSTQTAPSKGFASPMSQQPCSQPKESSETPRETTQLSFQHQSSSPKLLPSGNLGEGPCVLGTGCTSRLISVEFGTRNRGVLSSPTATELGQRRTHASGPSCSHVCLGREP